MVRGGEYLVFWVPMLRRAFVVWCIHMVHLYGGGAVGVLGSNHRGGYLWAGVCIWCIYVGRWSDWVFSAPTIGKAFVG